MADDCLFCKILAGEIPADKVYEDEEVFAFRDINPAAPTHILIIPREHIEKVSETTAEHEALLGKLVLRANEIARQEGIESDGYRLVFNNGLHGGQTVYHVHLHILGGRQFAWPPG